MNVLVLHPASVAQLIYVLTETILPKLEDFKFINLSLESLRCRRTGEIGYLLRRFKHFATLPNNIILPVKHNMKTYNKNFEKNLRIYAKKGLMPINIKNKNKSNKKD